MDPFEARLQFIQLLEMINPSTLAVNKSVSFAIKYQELHEDFHSCILEVLDKIDLNARINVLYFVQALVASLVNSNKDENFENTPYLRNLEKDFPLIVEKVVPSDNLINLNDSSVILHNVENYYKVSNELLRSKFLKLDSENFADADVEESSSESFAKSWVILINKKKSSFENRINHLKNGEENESNSSLEFTKDQILSRIEADRERHKRVKETNWIVNRPNGKIDYSEFLKIWNQFDELADQDFKELKELNQIAKESQQI